MTTKQLEFPGDTPLSILEEINDYQELLGWETLNLTLPKKKEEKIVVLYRRKAEAEK